MTRSSSVFLLRRAYEHLTASAGALGLTILLLLSVDARAASHRTVTPRVTPTVTIEIPTVEIEVIGADTTNYLAATGNDRVNG